MDQDDRPSQKDATMSIAWGELARLTGVIQREGFTTLAAFQVITEEEFGNLRNIGGTTVDAVKTYLANRNRRFRAANEHFWERADLVYGSVLRVPCAVAIGVYGRPVESSFGYNLNQAGYKTLANLANAGPKTVEECLLVPYPYGRISVDDLKVEVKDFIQWLRAQKVWG